MKKPLSNINNYLINGDKNNKWKDFELFLKNSDAELKKQYLKWIDTSFEVLYCIKMPTNNASLIRIFNTWIDEERKTFEIIGNDRFQALLFLKAAYYPDITMGKVISLCAFILQLIEKYNIIIYVGGKPYILKILDSREPLEMPET